MLWSLTFFNIVFGIILLYIFQLLLEKYMKKNESPNKTLINLPIFQILLNKLIILFTIFLIIFLDFLEANRPKIFMIVLFVYVVYILFFMIPININIIGIALKFNEKYNSKIKFTIILCLLILHLISSIYIQHLGFGLFIAITNRIR